MKIIIILLGIAIFACQHQRRPDQRTAVAPEEEASEKVYEGRIPLDEKTHLYLEISMLPSGGEGEGTFRISEFTEADHTYAPVSTIAGKYSTFRGETPDERIIHFHHSALDKALKRRYISRGSDTRPTVIREEPFRDTDVALKVQDADKLVVLDRSLDVISIKPEHNLVRRASPLFTLEGYFRHNGDTAEFYEVNTGQQWAVTKYGAYYNAITQYQSLTTQKFEVTHMKATGFSIRHTGKDLRRIDALVIRKVLQMSAAPGLAEGFNGLRP